MSKKQSRYRGIHWDRGKWAVRLRVNKVSTYIGRFDDEEEAARAYDEAARKNPHDRVVLNFPRPSERPFVGRTGLSPLFWNKVIPEPTTGCWLWIGAAGEAGYGHYGNGKTTKSAYRASYEDARGPVPEGAFLDHVCHTPSCVNPEHLRPATCQQNASHNRRAHGTSKFRGVYWATEKKAWVAMLKHNGKARHLGYFKDEEEAARAYDRATAKANGAFSMTNAKLGLLSATLLLSCMFQLRPHTTDHAQQTTAVCRVCEHVEGACSETVAADVCESATQAQRIDNITHGREPTP